MRNPTLFASRVFFWAGVYGIAIIAPMYLLEGTINAQDPPPLNHPEQYYGFVGVALAWQFAFLIIARDVHRYRIFMLPAMAEKFLYSTSVFALFLNGRVSPFPVGPAALDFLLGVLFVVSFVSLKKSET